ncbi:ABC transporter ATP-binding protein [Saccharospirillum mangrovi]|uniref:ABC transporter ATP-binding protein n=1 Tax=Saccharospirillum mangrovi TaxID=2161747 RepID=UPI000D346A82|nr:ABC transporter ATP-binding protein [Saccharospirillum mangrovi]
MSDFALTVEGLHKHFGDKTALAGIDLSLPKGQVLALLGPSGCGKTTLLRCIAGLSDIDAGAITLQGRQVAEPGRQLSPDERELGMVFQDYALWPHMTVGENVAFPLEMRGVAKRLRQEQVAWAISLVGLADFAARNPGSLSGGQQQRVALARAIVGRPKLLLMDEPLSNLDKGLRENLALEIRALIEELSLSAVFVTHDQQEAFALADQVAVLQQGRIQQIASPQALFRQPATPDIAAFVDAGALIDGRLDANGLHLGQQLLSLSSDESYQGPVKVLLPRHAIRVAAHGPMPLRARLLGRLFQGDHWTLRLQLDDHCELTIKVADFDFSGTDIPLQIDPTALTLWRTDGSTVSIRTPQNMPQAIGH